MPSPGALSCGTGLGCLHAPSRPASQSQVRVAFRSCPSLFPMPSKCIGQVAHRWIGSTPSAAWPQATQRHSTFDATLSSYALFQQQATYGWQAHWDLWPAPSVGPTSTYDPDCSICLSHHCTQRVTSIVVKLCIVKGLSWLSNGECQFTHSVQVALDYIWVVALSDTPMPPHLFSRWAFESTMEVMASPHGGYVRNLSESELKKQTN